MSTNTYIKKYESYLSTKIHQERAPDTYTRNYIAGEDHRERYAPYISGYWYLLLSPPKELVGDNNLVNYVKYFNGAAEAFTPPSRSIVKQEIVGFGGIKKFMATTQEYSNSFSITFREHGNLEVFNMLSHWAGLIHPFTGKHNKIYKGQCIVLLAKPTISGETLLKKPDIEEIFYFDGVFPESQPFDKFDSNIETNETKTVDVTFNFDAAPMTKFKYTDDINGEKFLEDFNTLIGEFKPHKAWNQRPTLVTVEDDQIGI